MHKKRILFEFEEYESEEQLNEADASLLKTAKKITRNAYAPYSNFLVGAATKLSNGNIVTGTNQENASYPVGICAERVLLSTVASLYPGAIIDTIAISYHNLNGESNDPVSPCGLCRQSLLEYETRVDHPIRIILSGMDGKVLIIPKASSLLPLSFTGDDMK